MYAQKPDCFRRAASHIRARCEDLQTNEESRVKGGLFVDIVTRRIFINSTLIFTAAISMTLCEIATAKYQSAPLECVAFEFQTRPQEGTLGDRTHASSCVESVFDFFERIHSHLSLDFRALSRSAQYWSSYSGYLREIRKDSVDDLINK